MFVPVKSEGCIEIRLRSLCGGLATNKDNSRPAEGHKSPLEKDDYVKGKYISLETGEAEFRHWTGSLLPRVEHFGPSQ